MVRNLTVATVALMRVAGDTRRNCQAEGAFQKEKKSTEVAWVPFVLRQISEPWKELPRERLGQRTEINPERGNH
jgi:hypothetical protein